APALGTDSRLPQVTPGAAAAAQPPVDPSPQGGANALRDNAVAFDVPDGGGLMAVVLIDDPDSPLDPDLLTRFTFPVSFAIDPLRADAAARASELRAAGFEVVIFGGGLIPEGAAPADVETALASARQTMPQAVALMDTPDSRIQGDRPVLDAAVGALAESGHGLLAFPRGLNAAEQSALRMGVPAATVFRLLDDEDERATVIARYLGRAGFAAGQDGAVVVVGRTRPDTVTALFSWALGTRSEQVALAPVSAVLQRLAE
ncbi:divergent polysaccharide deacetylase family protein, partial [Rhodobacterales bacterium HKCCSP123]|nr:divergent polysaccharide deacetylase family protein [Rhodobacterales bacterium HKCCSP123]